MKTNRRFTEKQLLQALEAFKAHHMNLRDELNLKTNPIKPVQVQSLYMRFIPEDAKEYILDTYFMNPLDKLYLVVVQENNPDGTIKRRKAIITDNKSCYDFTNDWERFQIEYTLVDNSLVTQDAFIMLFE